jgi:hypothetical protein
VGPRNEGPRALPEPVRDGTKAKLITKSLIAPKEKILIHAKFIRLNELIMQKNTTYIVLFMIKLLNSFEAKIIV